MTQGSQIIKFWAILFSILTGEKYVLQLFTLWTWLPVRITMYQPVLLYTTEEHGCSLTTFYVRVEQHEPTLLMIKTCNNEVWRLHLLLDSLIKYNRCCICFYGWLKILWLKAVSAAEICVIVSPWYTFLPNLTVSRYFQQSNEYIQNEVVPSFHIHVTIEVVSRMILGCTLVFIGHTDRQTIVSHLSDTLLVFE